MDALFFSCLLFTMSISCKKNPKPQNNVTEKPTAKKPPSATEELCMVLVQKHHRIIEYPDYDK